MKAGALLALFLASPPAAAATPGLKGAFKGKSVVLVSIDTLRADHLGAYGYRRPTSPTVDALARESTLFERAYSQAPVTAPSHMTMMTGVLPPVHGVRNSGHPGVGTRLSDSLPTLATLLKQAGYRTAAHTGGGNVSAELGFDQGFDSYSASFPGDLRLAGRALAETGRRGKPLFFFAHTYDVHDPYLPPPETQRLFADPAYAGRLLASRDELARAAGSERWADVVREFWNRFDRKSPADVRHLVDLYDAEIRAMDERLAEFLRRFREAGLERDAILVFVSDHGEEFLDHGATRHGRHLYEEILHVPLIVRLPGGAAARRPEPVRLVDLTPTLLELLGLPVPAHVQGAALLSGGETRGRPVYATEPRSGVQALRLGNLKFVKHLQREELFDLEADPQETKNRLGTDDAYLWRSRLNRILEACLNLGAQFGPSRPRSLDPQTLRELEALGYVGGGQVRFAATAVLLATWLAAAAAPRPTAAGRGAFKGKSVVLVSIDTLRADHLGAYGYPRPTSPVLDTLARESILFERAYSQSPATAPSHMTLLTGVLPSVHRVISWHSGVERTLSDRLPTLASLLGRAGYRTAAHTGGGNVDAALGFDQGFESFVSVPWGDIELAGRTLLELARSARGSPFFFFAHTYEVHAPYVPPAAYARLFVDPGYAGRIVSSREELIRRAGTDAWDRLHKPFWAPVDAKDPADVRHLVDLYDGGIRRIDDQMALFLRYYREAGLDRNAVLVVTSDHGEEFMEHGRLQHGTRMYEEALHVPLLVRLPSGSGAERRGEIVRLLDLVPSLLDWLGLGRPEHLQGDSLLGLLKGASRPRPVYAEEIAGGLQSLRLGDLKYLRHGESEALYDLATDPGERQSRLTPEERYTWRSRASRIGEANLQLADSFEPGARPKLDAETLRQLQALGYVGGP